MSVTNLAIGQQVNLATILNTKLEKPILQSEMGLDVLATLNGQAIRWNEYTLRHNNTGTLKNTMYKKNSVASPSATANTYGTAITLAPITNYTGLFPNGIDVVFGGTFGSETVTANITVTFSDTTTALVNKTATVVGTSSLTNSDLMTLSKDGVYITQIVVQSQSTIASSATTVTFNHFGLYI